MEKNRYFTWKHFSTSGKRHCYEWKPIFKVRTYSCRWRLIFCLVQTLFYLFFRHFCQWFIQIPDIYASFFLILWKRSSEANASFWPVEMDFLASETILPNISNITSIESNFFYFLEINFKRILYYSQSQQILCLVETIFFHSDFFGKHYCN